MASFRYSFVTISEERSVSLSGNVEEEVYDGSEQFSGDAVMIEEITIIVRADTEHPHGRDEDQQAIATLDPMSQLLWLQALRHLH